METQTATPRDRRRRLDARQHRSFAQDFLDHLISRGNSPTTVGFYSGSARHFAAWLSQSKIALSDVDDGVVRRFADHDCRCLGLRRSGRLGIDYIYRVRQFLRFLRSLSVVPAASEPPAPVIDGRVAAFQDWLRRHRGIAEPTILQRSRLLMQVLPALGADPVRYTAVLVRDVFLDYSCTAASRHYPRLMATALRGYLRFLAARGVCPPDLDHAIPSVRCWRLASLPQYLAANDVERLIASCDVAEPGGIRDRAILLLLARLGLRAGDVLTLRLGDIEWEQGTLRVRGKGRRVVRLPLPQDAGDALLDYLMHGRPATDTDTIFLRLLPPYTPLAQSVSVSSVVDRALKRAGIKDAPSRGSNLLRHSAATAMLRGGASLETIGTVLRHRSIDTTAHYAKVDLGLLGEIAQPWPAMEAVATYAAADRVALRRIVQAGPEDLSC